MPHFILVFFFYSCSAFVPPWCEQRGSPGEGVVQEGILLTVTFCQCLLCVRGNVDLLYWLWDVFTPSEWETKTLWCELQLGILSTYTCGLWDCLQQGGGNIAGWARFCLCKELYRMVTIVKKGTKNSPVSMRFLFLFANLVVAQFEMSLALPCSLFSGRCFTCYTWYLLVYDHTGFLVIYITERVGWCSVRGILFPSLFLSENSCASVSLSTDYDDNIAVSNFIAEYPPWKGDGLQIEKLSLSYTFTSGWLSLNSFLRWGKRLEVTLVSELEAEPESCPSFTSLTQSGAVLCACWNSCSEQKESFAFAACSSSGVGILSSLIFSGLYGTLQAQAVPRSVTLKLVMPVGTGKVSPAVTSFFPFFSHVLNFCLTQDQLPTL